MKKKMILKLFVIFALMATACNKDDDNKDDQSCVKEENFFEAEFNGETIEPYYLVSGATSFYTLNYTRCFESDTNWSLSISTENDIRLYLYLIDITETGTYSVIAGDLNHTQALCYNATSIYLVDDVNNVYTYISTGNGQIEITEYNAESGIFAGTFSCEMVSTTNSSVKKVITGEFNVNKSTLDNFEKPCWL